ncbi:MAG: TetR/AcrR family transcriptional regulator [Cohaesibacteraceae bacterium]|nr:TetR/AcrR family transcriptional regulator [Cohaesibacteraceae bacterium]
MPRLDNPRTKILQTAQQMAQNRGFGGFSFRDIAADIGIKSASIHYHFPTKDHLIIEISKTYREDFFATLGSKTKEIDDPLQRIMTLVAMFRHVLTQDHRMCLCGMLAADIELLSLEARAEIKLFFDASVNWLAQQWAAHGSDEAHNKAMDTFVRLEGGMLISRISASTEPFDVIERAIAAG